jgi:pimeloyl-ACP methyl ester carboxylesterase
MTVVLVHGGLWEDMDAERFWVRPGIVAGLRAAGVDVLAPDRLPRPPSWAAEVEHLLPLLPAHPVTLVGGSNGCSVVVRIALTAPDRVDRLVLAWPATAGESTVDEWARAQGAPAEMLSGETLRGVADAELATLQLPVAVQPGLPNPFHRRSTVDRLLATVPDPVELRPGTPEPPRPDFAEHRDGLVSRLAEWDGRRAARTG